MAKVTQQDVVNFLKEKVTQLTTELESATNALNALQGSLTTEATATRGRKPKAAGTSVQAASVKRKNTAKAGGAKRGRKPKIREVPADMATEQQAVQE